MGRPTVYGKQVVMHNRKFVGINLGYNFYCEHQGGVDAILQKNWDLGYKIMFANLGYNTGYLTQQDMANRQEVLRQRSKKRKRLLKSAQKAANSWKSTPFNGYVLPNFMEYGTRYITVDNTPIFGKWSTFQIPNGSYILLYLGASNYDIRGKFGDRKKFTEEDLLYLPDYQGCTLRENTGRILNNASMAIPDTAVWGSWASGDDVIRIIVRRDAEFIVEGLIRALEAGCLACTPELQRIYKDRGLCLTALDVAYLNKES